VSAEQARTLAFYHEPPEAEVNVALLIATPQLSQLACRSHWQVGRSVRKPSKTRAEVQNLTSTPTRLAGCPAKSLTDKSRQWRQESRRATWNAEHCSALPTLPNSAKTVTVVCDRRIIDF